MSEGAPTRVGGPHAPASRETYSCVSPYRSSRATVGLARLTAVGMARQLQVHPVAYGLAHEHRLVRQ